MAKITLRALFRLVGLTMTAKFSGNQTTAIAPKLGQYYGGNIGVGVGYSNDAQQVSTQQCYDAIVSSISDKETRIELNEPLSFSKLSSRLGIFVDHVGQLEMFSTDLKADYMRSLQDNEHAMSLNYYTYVAKNVTVKIGGLGDEALTKSGKSLYDRHRNKYFGLLCGDNYITSYQKGGLLTIGLNLEFSSVMQKNTFITKSGVVFGDIVKAIETIKSVVAENKITGLVMVQAFQIGGNQSSFYNVLTKHNGDRQSALTCDFAKMDDCVDASHRFLNYAENDFPTQFPDKNDESFVPLGIGFTQYRSINDIGLVPPVSFVTPEVVLNRQALSRILKQNLYYQSKIYPFLNKGYPVKLHDSFIEQANAIFSESNNNILILMQRHGGAADCFNFPDQCESIKANIYSLVYDFTDYDLTFLDDIKFEIMIPGGALYNTGGKSADSWDGGSDDPHRILKLESVSIKDGVCSYCAEIENKTPIQKLFRTCFNGTLTGDGRAYAGIMRYQLPKQDSFSFSLWVSRSLSPFFFKRYNILTDLQQRVYESSI